MKNSVWKNVCRKIGQTCKARPTLTLRYDVSTSLFRAKDDVAKETPVVAKAEKGDISIDLVRAAALCGAAALALLVSSLIDRN